MRSICVKDIMVPITDYATVPQEATLLQAIIALEKSQKKLDPSQHKHRAILILGESGHVVGKITMKNILITIEPNFGKVESTGVLERSGYSPDLIKLMLEDNTLWTASMQFVRKRATRLKVGDFAPAPSKGEYIGEDATLGEAIHQLVAYPYHSLLVTRADVVVGVLRLSDVFAKICDEIMNR